MTAFAQVDVFMFTGMAALLFGLAGVQLYAGSFGRGCVLATGEACLYSGNELKFITLGLLTMLLCRVQADLSWLTE